MNRRSFLTRIVALVGAGAVTRCVTPPPAVWAATPCPNIHNRKLPPGTSYYIRESVLGDDDYIFLANDP